MKAKVVRFAVIAIAGVGLFVFQGVKQESAQSANAQALKDPIVTRGKPFCYSEYITQADRGCYLCGDCSLHKGIKGVGDKRTCESNNNTETPIQQEEDVAP